jgi:glycosyltransferase involved in cell wall biosynthesis
LPGVLVAEHWDSQSFARHIAMLLAYKDLRKGMGKANQKAVEKITWDEAAKQILLHYQALLNA